MSGLILEIVTLCILDGAPWCIGAWAQVAVLDQAVEEVLGNEAKVVPVTRVVKD